MVSFVRLLVFTLRTRTFVAIVAVDSHLTKGTAFLIQIDPFTHWGVLYIQNKTAPGSVDASIPREGLQSLRGYDLDIYDYGMNAYKLIELLGAPVNPILQPRVISACLKLYASDRTASEQDTKDIESPCGVFPDIGVVLRVPVLSPAYSRGSRTVDAVGCR
jgi:hypothetical protein